VPRLTISLLACLLLTTASLLSAADPDKTAADLIARLGDADSKVRQESQEALINLGLPAAPLLLEAAKDADPERASRAKEVLEKMDEPHWGTVTRDGVRIGLSLLPRWSPKAYPVGDTVEYIVYARNDTDSDTQIRTNSLSKVFPEVVNRDITIFEGLSAVGPSNPGTLAVPAHKTVVVRKGSFQILPFGEKIEAQQDKVTLRPGQYHIGFGSMVVGASSGQDFEVVLNFKKIKDLRELRLANSAVTDADLQGIKVMAGLKSLDLSNTAITGEGLKEVAQIESLESLNLAHTKIKDADLKNLKGLKGLKDLNLIGILVTDVGMKDLAAHKGLQKLSINSVMVTDAGMKELKELKGLQWLYLVIASKVTDAGLMELKDLKELRHLEVTNCGTTAAGRKSLREAIPGIKVLPEP
jgi:hypothetical protein